MRAAPIMRAPQKKDYFFWGSIYKINTPPALYNALYINIWYATTTRRCRGKEEVSAPAMGTGPLLFREKTDNISLSVAAPPSPSPARLHKRVVESFLNRSKDSEKAVSSHFCISSSPQKTNLRRNATAQVIFRTKACFMQYQV